MDTSAVFAVVATAGLLIVAANLAGRGSQAIGGLFAPPALGWPRGVQEDDDLAWRWSMTRVSAPRTPAEPDAAAVATHVVRARTAVRDGRSGVPPGP